MDINELISNPPLDLSEESKKLRQSIISMVSEYQKAVHSIKPFEPGKSLIPTSGKVFDNLEVEMLEYVGNQLDAYFKNQNI